MQYQRLENESDDALIYRVCKDKDKIGSWQLVADILNALLGTDYGESTFRKKYAAFNQMFEANRDLFVDDKKQLKAIREEQRRLEIEKIKFRDERNEWSRQNRVAARAEEKLDNLESALTEIARVEFPAHSSPVSVVDGQETVLIMLNDLHIGANFDSYWGRYNVDIAKERLDKLLSEVKYIANIHGAAECFVVLGGDNISGNIHRSIQVSNRENVIDQIKKCVELVASFCYELTTVFSMVTLIGVDGNHSRIDKKEDAIHDERLDSLIPYCVDLMLQHVKNFYYCSEANIDSGIAMFFIHDKCYIAVHGDYDSFTSQGVQNLITMVHAIPYAVLFGHKHHCAVDEANGIKMIQGGSLAGSGEQFTIEKRIRGNASQMVCVCTDRGIESYYPIEFE